MKVCANTHIGKKRTVNQDCYFACPIGKSAALCGVFDGMGGHAGGETASRVAMEKFRTVATDALNAAFDRTTNTLPPSSVRILNILTKAAQVANTAVYNTAAENIALEGMGTTLAAALVKDGILYGINVGDSRIYRTNHRKGGMQQLSHDHSYVQYLVDIGQLTPEEARTNNHKNVITRAIGTEEYVEVNVFTADIAGEDVLLCSDGLSGMVSDSGIYRILKENADPVQAVNTLIGSANNNGGVDNITVILLRLT